MYKENSSLKIQFDAQQKKFFVNVDANEAYLLFRQSDSETIEYYSTYVPLQLRNRGIAAQMVEYALQYAQQRRLKVIPTCSYVDDYIQKRPQYQHLVSEK